MKRNWDDFSILWMLILLEIVHRILGRPEPSLGDRLFMAELLLAGIIGYLVSIRKQLKEKAQ